MTLLTLESAEFVELKIEDWCISWMDYERFSLRYLRIIYYSSQAGKGVKVNAIEI